MHKEFRIYGACRRWHAVLFLDMLGFVDNACWDVYCLKYPEHAMLNMNLSYLLAEYLFHGTSDENWFLNALRKFHKEILNIFEKSYSYMLACGHVILYAFVHPCRARYFSFQV